jgi:hypothetical protein
MDNCTTNSNEFSASLQSKMIFPIISDFVLALILSSLKFPNLDLLHILSFITPEYKREPNERSCNNS